MSIVVRPPGAEAIGTSHVVTADSPGDGAPIDTLLPSSQDLLPADDVLAPAPALTPSRALALDALRLSHQLRESSRGPAHWTRPGFGREVEVVLEQLAPVRSRAALAGSYGREAFRRLPADHVPDGPDAARAAAVRVAYALRWLDLTMPVRGGARASATAPGGPSPRAPRPRTRVRRWRGAAGGADRTR